MNEHNENNPLEQDEDLMDQDLQQDEEQDMGIKGGSVTGQSDDAIELDDPMASDDSDSEIVDSEEYNEYDQDEI